MIVYVDSSVLLRIALGQPDRLAEWESITRPITSALAEVECCRTLDRRRAAGLINPADHAERRGLVLRLLERMDRVDLTGAVMRRAADPFPTPLGTLDALHLATAILWGAGYGAMPIMATHDGDLARGARAMGLIAIGA